METRKKMRLIWTALLSLIGAWLAAGWSLASNTAAVPLNTAPRITGLESASFAENSSGPVATYSAHDAEGGPMTWSLSGRDAGAFTFITDAERPTMTLLFRAVPDYERPADVPPIDNDYQLTVVATDTGQPALATHYPVRVTVVNVAEASPRPVIAEPEQMRSTTQAEYVGRMVWAVFNFYKDIMGWAWRGVVNHVRTVFNAGQLTQSDAPVRARVPDAPEVSVYSGALSAMETSGRVQVSVRKPAAHGSVVTGYEYQLYEGEERLLDWTSAGVDATTLAGLDPEAVSSFSVGGLLHGQTYAVVVRAVNGVGAGGSVWGMATPGRILAPERVQAVAGDGLVELTWAAAATEGPVLTRYEVRWRPIWGDWSAWEPVAGDASARDHAVEGLENGVKYTFAVRAANPAGAGLVAQIAARPQTAEPDGTGALPPTEPRGDDPL